jgi:phage protein D
LNCRPSTQPPEAELFTSSNPALVRRPQVQVVLNDSVTLLPTTVDVVHHATYTASTFRIRIPLTGNPDLQIYDWSDLNSARVRIQISLDSGVPFVDLIEGSTDILELNPVTGVIQLEGRDLSCSLLDTKMPTDFQNQTPTEIARVLAIKHGLTPVIATTSAYVGRLYSNNYNITSLAQYSKLASDWDVLALVARSEGCDLFVNGTELVIQPQISRSDAPQYVRLSELTDLRLFKVPALAGGGVVTVTSWNSATGALASGTSNIGSARNTDSNASDSQSKYTLVRPNLSVSAAQTLATREASQTMRNSQSVQFTMPAEYLLDPHRPIRLEGTNTSFDDIYGIDTIARSYRPKSGLTQTVRARVLV